MKSWLTLGAAILGAYFAYHLWFSTDEPPEDQAPRLVVDEPEDSGEASEVARPEKTPAGPIPLEVRSERDGPAAVVSRDGPAWRLFDERQEARDAGDVAKERGLVTRILKEHPRSDPAVLIRFERGRKHLAAFRQIGRSKEGLLEAQKARLLLTPALFVQDAEPRHKEELRTTLTELADAVLFSSRHVEDADRTHMVRSGENLSTLCSKLFRTWGAKVSPGFVAEVNGLKSPSALRAGVPLKVPLGESRIVVIKEEFRLYFLQGGAYVRDFPVGLGKDGLTPEAVFTIGTKQVHPDWYPEPGVKIPYGDPRNILGSRWMSFRNTDDYRGFGIHGTSDPDSIGQAKSSGCVRMHKPDVERLFAWTARGTTVEIRR